MALCKIFDRYSLHITLEMIMSLLQIARLTFSHFSYNCTVVIIDSGG